MKEESTRCQVDSGSQQDTPNGSLWITRHNHGSRFHITEHNQWELILDRRTQLMGDTRSQETANGSYWVREVCRPGCRRAVQLQRLMRRSEPSMSSVKDIGEAWSGNWSLEREKGKARVQQEKHSWTRLPPGHTPSNIILSFFSRIPFERQSNQQKHQQSVV